MADNEVMDNAQKVKDFLAANPGRFFCNRCLSDSLYLSNPTQVNQLTRPLRGIAPYRSGKMICHYCHQDRECIAHG
jgi:hypothetical protein